MPRYLPLLLILRTTRHLTTQTSVSLFPSSCTYISSLSLASSLLLLVLRASVPLAFTHISFMILLPPAASVHLPRIYIAECTIVTLLSVLHGRRLRRVLCSFRQFNATISHERPIVRSDCQSFRQIVIPKFLTILFYYFSTKLGLIELTDG